MAGQRPRLSWSARPPQRPKIDGPLPVTRITIAIALTLVATGASAQQAQTDADEQWEQEKQRLLDGQRQQAEQRQAEIAAKSPPSDPYKWARDLHTEQGGWTFFAGYDDGKAALL